MLSALPISAVLGEDTGAKLPSGSAGELLLCETGGRAAFSGVPVGCSMGALEGEVGAVPRGPKSPLHLGLSTPAPPGSLCHVNPTTTSWIISYIPSLFTDQIAMVLKYILTSWLCWAMVPSIVFTWQWAPATICGVSWPWELYLETCFYQILSYLLYKNLDTGVEMCSADSWKKNKSPNTRWLTFWAYLTLPRFLFGSDLRFHSLMTQTKENWKLRNGFSNQQSGKEYKKYQPHKNYWKWKKTKACLIIYLP